MSALFTRLGLATAALAAACAGASASPKCADHDMIVKALSEKFEETRQAIGLVSASSVMEIFRSPRGTWTMLVTDTKGVSCIVAAGEEWQDAPQVAGLDS